MFPDDAEFGAIAEYCFHVTSKKMLRAFRLSSSPTKEAASDPQVTEQGDPIKDRK